MDCAGQHGQIKFVFLGEFSCQEKSLFCLHCANLGRILNSTRTVIRGGHQIDQNTASEMKQKHARKQNYVDSSVQGALLKRIILHWFMYFVVAGLAIVMLQAMLSGPQGDPLSVRIMQEIGEFTLVGLILICIFPAFLLDTVRFSNRFVGPVGRLRSYLRKLGQDGNTEPLSFRGNDFWAEMSDEYNLVAQRFEEQAKEIERLKSQLKNSGVTSRN
jgi:hypothetical protein